MDIMPSNNAQWSIKVSRSLARDSDFARVHDRFPRDPAPGAGARAPGGRRGAGRGAPRQPDHISQLKHHPRSRVLVSMGGLAMWPRGLLKRHPTPGKPEAYTRFSYTTPGCPEPCSCTCGVHEAAGPSEGDFQSSHPQFASTARGRPYPTTPHSKFEPGHCEPCARFSSGCHISPGSGKDGISVAQAIRAERQRRSPRWHRSRWPRKRCCLIEVRRAGVPLAAF